MRALAIIRVSSEDQKKGYGLDEQWEDDILANAPTLGLEVSEDLRRSITERATTWERVEFTGVIREAIDLYQNGRIEAVVFPRVDRETRFVFGSMPLLAEMLKVGLKVFFARELLYLDPRDPESVDRYLRKVSQSHANVETNRVNTMLAKKHRAKRDGLLPTGGLNLYGYNYDKNTGKRTKNEYEVAIIRKMVDWVTGDHQFLNEVCRRLMGADIPAPKGGKRWSRSTVGRILRNRTYTGETYACKMESIEPQSRRGGQGKTRRRILPKEQWVRLPDDTTPQIIAPEEFEAIQRQLDRNSVMNPRNNKYEYLMRGYVWCGLCGRRYYGTPRHPHRYYRCSSRNSVRAHGEVCECDNNGVNADALEYTAWCGFWDMIMKPDMLVAAYRAMDTNYPFERLIQQRDRNQTKLQKLKDVHSGLFNLSGISEKSLAVATDKIQRNEAQQEEVEGEIAQLDKDIQEYRKIEATDQQIRLLAEWVREAAKKNGYVLTSDMKRRLFEAWDMRVWVEGKDQCTLTLFVPLSLTPLYRSLIPGRSEDGAFRPHDGHCG